MLPFLYPLKIPENQKFFWRFQGVKNGNIRQKWVKFGEDVSISEKFGSALHLDESFIVTNRKKYVWIYIYSYLMEYFFQGGFNSSELFPAVKTSYCISFIKPFVT